MTEMGILLVLVVLVWIYSHRVERREVSESTVRHWMDHESRVQGERQHRRWDWGSGINWKG